MVMLKMWPYSLTMIYTGRHRTVNAFLESVAVLICLKPTLLSSNISMINKIAIFQKINSIYRWTDNVKIRPINVENGMWVWGKAHIPNTYIRLDDMLSYTKVFIKLSV